MRLFKSNLLFRVFIYLTFLSFPALVTAQGVDPGKWKKAMLDFDKRDQVEQVRPGANLFVGSSSITNWKDIANYFDNVYIINRGFGGSRFKDLIYFYDRVITPYKPSKIFIYEGDNDIAGGMTPREVMKEARLLREKIAKDFPGTPVVFISVKPSVSRWRLRKEYTKFNKSLKKFANRTPHTAYADVWTPMLAENGIVRNDIFLKDNLHMKPEGYKIWQKVLEPYLVLKKD
ncbi:MAG TPA: GDSL-type esterase/lipase family protein [Sphingobacteriaceae bacterium]